MSNTNLAEQISAKLKLKTAYIQAVIDLVEEGATVPFISRYRKEATGSMDEVAVQNVCDAYESLQQLIKRREAIVSSLEERELLTNQLSTKLDAADTLAALEDIYLPFRPKRRTRATIAREKGLEPLAQSIYDQSADAIDVDKFIDAEKDVKKADDAWAGARDIIAEWVNENSDVRGILRELYSREAVVSSTVVKAKENEAQIFRDYFDWNEPLSKVPSHRLLAILRGSKEGYLTIHARPDAETAVESIESFVITNKQATAVDQLKDAIDDSYKRLLFPSLEKEFLNEAKTKADQEAIAVFGDNLRELLLAAPLGRKRILGIDPGLRTGCKVAVLDDHGTFIKNTTINLVKSDDAKKKAAETVKTLCAENTIEAIAVGNGTAGRETEQFVRDLNLNIPLVLVNESGASIYSASEVARKEFPELDLTVRGAISIGRRLQDPLAELVKIDAKSIGVGQYQHDVDQSELKKRLDLIVQSCVNAVGVDVNTASEQLLTYVAGLGPQLAKNIIAYRSENGGFTSRPQLKKVARLGPKAYEQCAGFLRITDAKNPLDNSGVHPESYKVVKEMAKDTEVSVADLISSDDARSGIALDKYVSEKIGLPTLNDIMLELAKPGRDPRPEFEAFSFDESIHSIKDLSLGMTVPGLVTNVTKFGAFVDIGVHQDGLVHLSQMSHQFVSDPSQIVKVGDKVEVRVIEVEVQRKRIGLSMKSEQAPAAKRPTSKRTHQPANKQEFKKNSRPKNNKKNNSFKKNNSAPQRKKDGFATSLGDLFDF